MNILTAYFSGTGCTELTAKTLSPKYGTFAVFKNGFSIKIIASLPNDPDLDVEKEAKGNIWLSVKKYLLDTTDLLEPAHKK